MSILLARNLSSRIIASRLKIPLLSKHPQSPILQVQKRNKGDHSYHWITERVVTISLMPVIPLALLTPNFYLDNVLTILLCLHSHWGITSITMDYIRPKIFGPIIPKVAVTTILLITIATTGCLLRFNYKDVGISRAIRQFWDLKPGNQRW